MPAVCAADSGAFAQRWCAGLDSEIVFSLLKNLVRTRVLTSSPWLARKLAGLVESHSVRTTMQLEHGICCGGRCCW